MNSGNLSGNFNCNKTGATFQVVFEIFPLKTVLRRAVWVFFLFFSLIPADWPRTSGCLHGRALDMIICMALYRGLQIFARRFGGKCLDQCKHCRPQRNPRSSRDHSGTLLYPIVITKEPLDLCQIGWAHAGVQVHKKPGFHCDWFHSFCV